MPKTRLSNEKREYILQYMMEQFTTKRDKSEEEAALTAVIEGTNAALRAKYPEKDMRVLRRYNVTRLDHCIRFSVDGTGQVFGVELYHLPDEAYKDRLADIPARAGCRSSEVFPCDQAFADLYADYEKLVRERKQAISAKRTEYNSFLYAAKTVEDVEAVVPLPEAIRTRLGAAVSSLVAISDETIANIRDDFAVAA